MEEVLMVPPQQMEKLIQYYKGELTENALLNKAARTAAKRDIILNSKLPAGIIKAKVKPLSRELHHLTKRVRRGPVGGLGGKLEENDDEEDDSLVTGPVEQIIKKIIKGTHAKKKKSKLQPSRKHQQRQVHHQLPSQGFLWKLWKREYKKDDKRKSKD